MAGAGGVNATPNPEDPPQLTGVADRLMKVVAESKFLVARLKRLENAFVQVAEILVVHGERFDRIETRLGGIDDRLEGIDDRLRGVTDRLDRLIAVTIEERTFGGA